MEEYYNIKEGDLEEEEDPRKVNINESEGFREVRGNVLNDYALEYSKPMRTMKVNIGTSENTKLEIIGDYRDEES